MRVLLTGANRGLGLEWVRQLAVRGETVFATCRQPEKAKALHDLQRRFPDNIKVFPLDVRSQASIAQAVNAVAAHTNALDVLINNAGILFEHEHITNLQAEHLKVSFQVNAIGPIMLAKQALTLLQRGKRPVVFNVSTMLASLTLKTFSGYYSYSASKAALNMLTRTLAAELRPQKVIVVAVHPGWVRTEMGGPGAPLSPEVSVQGMLRLLDSLTMRHSGRFWTWEGQEHPW